MLKHKQLAMVFAASTLMAAGSAFATAPAIDVTDVTTAITNAGVAAGTVGMAVVVMIVGIKVFKWLRRAL